MPPAPSGIFTEGFLIAIQAMIGVHHSIYPTVPPQGIYFEALVERAFKRIKKPFTVVEAGGRNQPRHDLLVENHRISLKTETGAVTRRDRITITKLCTTEREPWDAETLVGRVLEHLTRYDIILMLRAVWDEPLIHYQLLEIPVGNLMLIEGAAFAPVGRRQKSLGADIIQDDKVLFHVHFDSSDRKCSVRNLRVADCAMLEEWDIRIEV
jgi:hypothetical protein